MARCVGCPGSRATANISAVPGRRRPGTGGVKTAKTQKPAAQAPAPKPATPAARRPAAAKVATASAVANPSRPVTRKPVRKPVVPAQKTRGTRTGMVAQGVCAQLSPLSRRYMGNDADVRCGPQRADPVSGGRDLGASARPAAGSGAAPRNIAERGARIVRGTRIVPRHVHEKQQQSADLSGPPEGYAPVWEDDRLNRKRAHQTLTGKRRMEARWTNTVPRELKPASLAPGARVIHAPSARIVPGPARPRLSTSSPAPRAPAATPTAQPRVSSKSAPPDAAQRPDKAKPTRRDVTDQYVQVAHFSDEAAMRAAAARLRAAGLKVQGRALHPRRRAAPVADGGPLHRARAVAGGACHRAQGRAGARFDSAMGRRSGCGVPACRVAVTRPI